MKVARTRGFRPVAPGSCTRKAASATLAESTRSTHKGSLGTQLTQHTFEVQRALSALFAVLLVGDRLEGDELAESVEERP